MKKSGSAIVDALLLFSSSSSSSEDDDEDDIDQAMESVNRSSGARRTLHHDLTSELYKTAEIDCGDQEEEDEDDQDDHDDVEVSPGVSMEVDTGSHSVLHVGDNWTMSLQPEDDTNDGGSKADTGYGTHTSGYGTSNITPSSASTSHQDSGMVTLHQDNTGGVSVLAPPQPLQQQQQQQQVLMSYHNDNSNDISVGFPLGSSTPTKK